MIIEAAAMTVPGHRSSRSASLIMIIRPAGTNVWIKSRCVLRE
jgi:hypothetical protein